MDWVQCSGYQYLLWFLSKAVCFIRGFCWNTGGRIFMRSVCMIPNLDINPAQNDIAFYFQTDHRVCKPTLMRLPAANGVDWNSQHPSSTKCPFLITWLHQPRASFESSHSQSSNFVISLDFLEYLLSFPMMERILTSPPITNNFPTHMRAYVYVLPRFRFVGTSRYTRLIVFVLDSWYCSFPNSFNTRRKYQFF